MDRTECGEWIRLVDEYGRAAAAVSRQLQSLAGARIEAQRAWDALERHMREHRCQELFPDRPSVESHPPLDRPPDHRGILGSAAAATLDLILVVDDQRRFVEVNQAAVDVFGLPRGEIVGRRIDEFFSEARGEAVPDAWARFVADGIQTGVCELIRNRRRFDYRARANFVPGLHVSVLRDVTPPAESQGRIIRAADAVSEP